MNIAKLQAQLQHVPDSALIDYVQNPNGQVPSYLALAEISRRKNLRQQGTPKEQAPQATVAQQVVQEAQPGVAALPVREDMFQEESYANGGIVAFADGGSTYGYPRSAPGLSEADLAYAEALRNSGVANAAGTLLDYTAFLPYTLGKKGYEYLQGRQPVWDPVQGKYVLKRDMPDTSAADKEAAFKAEGEAGRKVREAYLQANPTLSQQMVAEQNAATQPPLYPYADPRMIAEKNKQQIIADMAAGKYDTPAPTPKIQGPVGIGSLGYKDLKYKPYTIDEAGFDALSPKERAMSDYAAEFRAELGEDPGRAKMKDRIAAMEAKAAKDEERAPWMALAEAGLGMAAGKSQFALQNIAEGGAKGLKAYADARDNLRKAEERRFDLEAKVAQAERAEQLAAINYGAENKRTEDAGRRAVGLAKQSDKARAAEINAKQEYDAIKDKYSLQQRDSEIGLMSQRLDKQIAAAENTSIRTELQNRRDSLKSIIGNLEKRLDDAGKADQPDPKLISSINANLDYYTKQLAQLANYGLGSTGANTLPPDVAAAMKLYTK